MPRSQTAGDKVAAAFQLSATGNALLTSVAGYLYRVELASNVQDRISKAAIAIATQFEKDDINVAPALFDELELPVKDPLLEALALVFPCSASTKA